MPKCRTDLIHQAFVKLDKDGSGELTIDDLRGVYSVKKHPKYINGQLTEDQVLMEFLKSFSGPGKSFSGEVLYRLPLSV
jgi:Ca2+-binding EF-hand superfamily protein